MKKKDETAKQEIDDNIIESILIEDEEETKSSNNSDNNLQETIKELGNQAFLRHSEKTSYLSNDNINGLIRADAFNEYNDVNFGYRYKVIDTLIRAKPSRALSHNGYGLEKLIEIVKSIQASFEQTQLPSRMKDLLNR